MDYKKHYDQLITRGQGRLLEGYSEKHHIVPRCMGGSNDATNMVALTAEEHYVAHQLLVKMYPNVQGLIFAAHRMTSNPTGKRANNKLYGWLRKKAAKATSEIHKGKIVSKETRKKLSEAAKNRPPVSEGTRSRMSQAKKGVKRAPHSEATKEKIRIVAQNRPAPSAEHRRKNSEAHKGKKKKPHTKKTKQKISEANKGRKHSEESRRNMAESAKKREAKKHEVKRCLVG